MSDDEYQIKEYLSATVLVSGEFSDVDIETFGRQTHLHRVILARSPYFSRLFSSEWNSKSGKINYKLDFEDEFITQDAFDLAIQHLYGRPIVKTSKQPGSETPADTWCVDEVVSLVAVANFLSLPSLEKKCLNLLRSMVCSSNLAVIATVFSENDYGGTSRCVLEEIVSNFLCMQGFRLKPEIWLELPPNVVFDALRSDKFYIPDEEQRYFFIRELAGFIHDMADLPEEDHDQGDSDESATDTHHIEGASPGDSAEESFNLEPARESPDAGKISLRGRTKRSGSITSSRSDNYEEQRSHFDKRVRNIKITDFKDLQPYDRGYLVDAIDAIIDDQIFYCHLPDDTITDADKDFLPVSLPLHCVAKVRLKTEVVRSFQSTSLNRSLKPSGGALTPSQGQSRSESSSEQSTKLNLSEPRGQSASQWRMAGESTGTLVSCVPRFRFACEFVPSHVDYGTSSGGNISKSSVNTGEYWRGKTVWYGGSLWQVFLQRKPGERLGVFLKRVKPGFDGIKPPVFGFASKVFSSPSSSSSNLITNGNNGGGLAQGYGDTGTGSRSGAGGIASHGRMTQQEAVTTAAIAAVVGRSTVTANAGDNEVSPAETDNRPAAINRQRSGTGTDDRNTNDQQGAGMRSTSSVSISSNLFATDPVFTKPNRLEMWDQNTNPPYYDTRETVAACFTISVGFETEKGYKVDTYECRGHVDFGLNRCWGPKKGFVNWVEDEGWLSTTKPLRCMVSISLL